MAAEDDDLDRMDWRPSFLDDPAARPSVFDERFAGRGRAAELRIGPASLTPTGFSPAPIPPPPQPRFLPGRAMPAPAPVGSAAADALTLSESKKRLLQSFFRNKQLDPHAPSSRPVALPRTRKVYTRTSSDEEDAHGSDGEEDGVAPADAGLVRGLAPQRFFAPAKDTGLEELLSPILSFGEERPARPSATAPTQVPAPASTAQPLQPLRRRDYLLFCMSALVVVLIALAAVAGYAFWTQVLPRLRD
ncbi:uncharacterized protein V1510DRAFT_414060 [Dipodascopsis tothii]|uniref:uncharacterized protein n=1 Tax=Dipodascopsis tothii TaxID=44089 RepID=UPI0034CEED8A